MMTITKTGLISAAAALMLFAGLAGRIPAQVMVQTKPGDTPLSPSGNLPSATPQFGVKEARENLIRQIEKISTESEVYQHIADGLRQSFAGTHAEAIKGNLIGLKLVRPGPLSWRPLWPRSKTTGRASRSASAEISASADAIRRTRNALAGD